MQKTTMTEKQLQLENELLEIIDSAEELTRSDLQGIVSIFILRNCKE